MLKVLSNILCDLDPKVKVIGQKAGICDGVPSTSALVKIWKDEEKMCTIIVLMGAFLTIRNFLGSIGKRFQGRGLRDVSVESSHYRRVNRSCTRR